MQYCMLYQAAIRTMSKGTSAMLKKIKKGIENFTLDEIIFTDEEYEEANTDTMDSTSMPSSQMGVEDLEDSDSVPLYPGANVTIGAFLLALFTNKYNLVGDAIEQRLIIIALALPDHNVLCTSLHEFKKYFRNLKKKSYSSALLP